MKKKYKDLVELESNFFNLDSDNKIAYLKLEYDSPNDIFYNNIITNKPIIKNDVLEQISMLCDYVPKKYKIDLIIGFNRLDDYDPIDMEDILKKSIALEFKRIERKVISKNIIAIGLIIAGVIFLISLMLLEGLWKEGGTPKTIVTYILDILTTVTIWEAMTILVVKSIERRYKMNKLMKKFVGIHFMEK